MTEFVLDVGAKLEVCFMKAFAWFFLVNVFVLNVAKAEEACPDLSGSWDCNSEVIHSLFFSRSFAWPSSPEAPTAGVADMKSKWIISELKRDVDVVQYKFGVGRYAATFDARVQPEGVLVSQDPSKTVYYCRRGYLVMVTTGQESREKIKGQKSSNFVIQKNEFSRIDETHMAMVSYWISTSDMSTLKRTACVKK